MIAVDLGARDRLARASAGARDPYAPDETGPRKGDELVLVGLIVEDNWPAGASRNLRGRHEGCATEECAGAAMPNFESFSRGLLQLKAEPQITILRRGTISLNRSAYAELGSPVAVELLYDSGALMVGLRPIDVHEPNAYVVRHPAGVGRGPFVITAMAFTKFYGIDTSQSLRRDAFVEDGVLCVNLNDPGTPVTSNRASTTRAGVVAPRTAGLGAREATGGAS
jgi:hypothetical protein